LHQWYGEQGLDADEELEVLRQEREIASTFKPPMASSVKETVQPGPGGIGEISGKSQGF